MAFFPCDRGPHPNPRRNVNVYLGVLGLGPDQRLSGRLCDLHWREVEPHLTEYEVMSDGTAAPLGDGTLTCASCHEPVDQTGIRAFITAYPTKNDRKDYWAQVHESCVLPGWLMLLQDTLR